MLLKVLASLTEASPPKMVSSTNYNHISFVSITMRLVILLLDVHRRRTIEVVTSTKIEEKMTTKITKIKERSHATFLKRKHLMKSYMFPSRTNLMKMRLLHL